MASAAEQLQERDLVVETLHEILGDDNVLSEPEELLVYECDGLPQHKHPPRAVVFPASTEETSEVLEFLWSEGVSFAPRGAGTGLSGGALAINRGVIIELARMRKILRLDPENRLAVVQTGLVNLQLSKAAAPHDLYYVPDPSSQPSCTIGGNLAENAGGIHCLKYGTTTDHVLGARVVLSDGGIVDLGGLKPGYDLLGTFVGSEGTFGIATEATVRLSQIPPAVRTLLADFTNVDNASRAVSAIIAAGIFPAALEMMDQAIIRAVEASVFTAGLPVDAEAVLLVELDGIEAGIDDEAGKAEDILRELGARSVRRAADQNERRKLWAARKGAFGAVGRLSPDIMIQDAVVPRSRLPEVLSETYRISAKYNLQLANVFHAGDGNLHPLICFDLRRGDDLVNVRQAGREIMETCVRAGGSITGEHGVGLDKSVYLPLIFSEDDMSAMLQVRAAFDPSGLCNPGKIIPLPRGCGEARAVATHSQADSGLSDTKRPAYSAPARAAHSGGGRGARRQAQISTRLNEERVARELSNIVGSPNARRRSASELIAAGENSPLNIDRAIEVAPASETEAEEILKLAEREQLSVVPAGGGTWLGIGRSLERVDVIINTRRFSRIVQHEPADLVATAQSGVTLRDFQNHLAQSGQWLAVDPPDDGRCSLGGTVATGLEGAQSLGYGLPRSFVIGMRVVLSTGRTIKAGGNVVKNVAGYDLCKLFTGSYGTLGLITEVTFKLRPLPTETRTVIASGPMPSLLRAAQSIISEKLFPVALEVLSRGAASHLDLRSDDDPVVLARFAGAPRSVVFQAAHTLAIARREGARLASLNDEDEGLWRGLAALPLQFSGKLSWRARLRPSEMALFLDEMNELEEDEPSHPSLMWHAGVGDGRLRAIASPPVYHLEAVRVLESLRQKIENSGGSLVIENAPAEIKKEIDAWGDFGSAFELMKRVKQRLDPRHALSPGRFIGGMYL
jgi:glycolate oxidase subunit GlcD